MNKLCKLCAKSVPKNCGERNADFTRVMLMCAGREWSELWTGLWLSESFTPRDVLLNFSIL